jgi:hypothetical protein
MRLVNKRNLELAKLASKEESRYQLSAILLTEAETVVTDGHILARVSLPEHKPEQFPVIEGFTPNGSNRDALIPREAALDAAKRITKKTSIPILTCAAVSVDDKPKDASGDEAKSATVTIATTDLDTHHITPTREPEGCFPNWHVIWPKEAKLEIVLDCKLLIGLLQQAAQFGQYARFRFYGPDKAVRIDTQKNDDGQEFNALLMPARMDKFEAWEPGASETD